MQKYRLVSIYVNIHIFFYSLLTIIRKSGIRQLRGAGCAGREVSADYLLVFGNYNVILEKCTELSAIFVKKCTELSALSLFIRIFAAKNNYQEKTHSMYRQKIFILPVIGSPNWQIHLQRWAESIFSLMKSINTRIGQES